MAFKLEQAGFEVTSFADGSAALDAIRANRPRLAVLDVMMPGLSDIDVLREVRADESLNGVRIILLTARSRDLDVDAGFASGALPALARPQSVCSGGDSRESRVPPGHRLVAPPGMVGQPDRRQQVGAR